MHWKTTALLVTMAILAGSNFLAIAGGDKDKPVKALQGVWTAAKGDEKMKMTFDGKKFKLEFKGESASGTYTVNAAAKPATMDLLVVKGTGENTQKFEGKTSKAIYAIEGTKLKWLANEPGKDERPTAFPADGERAKGLYIVFDKAKK